MSRVYSKDWPGTLLRCPNIYCDRNLIMLSFNKPQLRVWFFSAEVSRPYKTQSRLNPAKTSNCPRSSVISTLAQPILVLAWELPSTLTSPDGPRTASQLLRTDVKYWAYNPVEPVVNLVDKLVSDLMLINVICTLMGEIIVFIYIWSLYLYIFFNYRPHLWHFQQASSWTLRSQPCPNYDWWCQHLVARRSCIPKETRNVITFPPIVTLIYFKKTFNHLSQTKTAATIKKLKRKIMNILNQWGNYTIYFAIDIKSIICLF